MAKRNIFYSFHFDYDVMRVQQIRNIGALEDNKPVTANQWEEVKRGGDRAIERWIEDNMAYKSCVVVLIGEKTSERKWVQYEILKAWNDRRGLLGVHIHNINCARNGYCRMGSNPFSNFNVDGVAMSKIVKCYNPSPGNAYSDIRNNLEGWIEEAIAIRNRY